MCNETLFLFLGHIPEFQCYFRHRQVQIAYLSAGLRGQNDSHPPVSKTELRITAINRRTYFRKSKLQDAPEFSMRDGHLPFNAGHFLSGKYKV